MNRVIVLGVLSLLVALSLGAALRTTATSHFGWGQAALLEGESGGAIEAKVATDAAGNAVAVWYQFDGLRTSEYANRYVAGSGWGVATRIESITTGDVASAQVAMDPGGNATAVWHQFDGSRYRVYANRFVPGVGWGSEVIVSNLTLGDAAWPQVGADGRGGAIAVFRQNDPGVTSIFANRYVPGTGWSGATLIETYASGSDDAQIGVATDGSAFAIWRQWDGSRNNIVANTFVPGSGWGTPVDIDAGPTEAFEPRVASDGSARAIVVWRQYSGSVINLYANRFVPGSGWGSATLLETDDTQNPSTAALALDSSGDGFAVWTQSDGTAESVWANRYAAGSGWGGAVHLETASGFAAGPRVATDGAGHAMAVWVQMDAGRLNAWASRYRTASGWGTPVLIETDNQDHASQPSVAMDPFGNALAVWPQSDGTRSNIWANRYVRDDAPPPLSLTFPTVVLTNNSTILVAGTTEPGSSVTINGASATVDPNGAFGAPVALTEGTNTFVVIATDAEGNTNTVVRSIILDTRPPSLSLSDPSAGMTNASTVIVAGTTEPGASVSVNGVLAVVAPDGTFRVGIALREGSNSIGVAATDAAGNVAQMTRSIVVDTVSPSVSAQAVGTLGRNDWYVSAVSVALSATDATSGVDRIEYRFNGTSAWYALPGASGTLILRDGTHRVEARAVDIAGNSGVERAISLRVDTVAPTVTLVRPLTGTETESATVEVAGTVNDATAVVLVNGEEVRPDATGAWRKVVALLVGSNDIEVRAVDAAGNAGSATTVRVTYTSPLPDLQVGVVDTAQAIASLGSSLTYGLLALLVVVVALQLILYRDLRRRLERHGEAGPSENAGEP